jgi:hypothetical protein
LGEPRDRVYDRSSALLDVTARLKEGISFSLNQEMLAASSVDLTVSAANGREGPLSAPLRQDAGMLLGLVALREMQIEVARKQFAESL